MKNLFLILALLIFACSSEDNNDVINDCPSNLGVTGFSKDYPNVGDYSLEIMPKDLVLLLIEVGDALDCEQNPILCNRESEEPIWKDVDESTYYYYFNQTTWDNSINSGSWLVNLICWEGVK